MPPQADATRPRRFFEAELVAFQRRFLGGAARTVEAVSTGGGTRSINCAFEAVLRRRRAGGPRPVVLTGNPHLAVERAERRFGFLLERLEAGGAIDVEKMTAELDRPEVAAVYAQTLSYTDGISDDVPAVLDALDARRRRPVRGLCTSPAAPPPRPCLFGDEDPRRRRVAP